MTTIYCVTLFCKAKQPRKTYLDWLLEEVYTGIQIQYDENVLNSLKLRTQQPIYRYIPRKRCLVPHGRPFTNARLHSSKATTTIIIMWNTDHYWCHLHHDPHPIHHSHYYWKTKMLPSIISIRTITETGITILVVIIIIMISNPQKQSHPEWPMLVLLLLTILLLLLLLFGIVSLTNLVSPRIGWLHLPRLALCHLYY